MPITRVRSRTISPVRWRQTRAASAIGSANDGFLFHRARRPTGTLYFATISGPTMRILFLHVDSLEYEVREKALKAAPDLPASKRRARVDEALAAFISAEHRDEANPGGAAKAAAESIADVAGQVHTKRIVLYPYAHLSSSLAAPGPAQEILGLLEKELAAQGFEVHGSPFGYYKSFKVAVKGHPLSELSREIVAEAAASGKEEVSDAVKAEAKLVSHWHILEPDGHMHHLSIKEGKVSGYPFEGHERLRTFATYEMAKSREAKEEPAHVRLMQELELVDYEPGSDPGNLRYYPKGKLIKALLEEFVSERVREYGALEVESPVMYDFEHPALKSYLNRFPARQYIVQTPNKRAFLRFSACFGQFLIMKDMVISYRQLPLPLYELTRYSFRAEQRGELAGLRRLRAFTMPDCHALVSDIEMAKEELMVRFELAWSLLEDCGLSMPEDFEVGMRVTQAFWEEHKDFVIAYAKRWGKPPMLPVWLSPTQVRLVPVAADDVEYARTLVPRLEGIRVDLDDSGDSLGKKIRNAEKEWVPYIVVIGKKEAGGGPVNVRIRETKEQVEMEVDALRKRIHGETKGRPFRPLAEPFHVSERPIFRG